MKAVAVSITVLALACASLAQQPTSLEGSKQQIMALETQAAEAATKGDTNFWDAHTTADYVRVYQDGRVADKNELRAAFTSGALKYSSISMTEEIVHIYGNSAVVVARLSVQGTSRGKPIDGDYRITRVWVKQGPDWKIAAFQSTKIPPSQ